MKATLIGATVALVAISILSLPATVLADNGKGTGKSNQKTVVQPPVVVNNYTQPYSSITSASQPITSHITPNTVNLRASEDPAYTKAGQTLKQAVCGTVKVYDNVKTVAGCTATAASVVCAVAAPLTGFTDTLPCAATYVYTVQGGAMDCVNGIGSAVAGKDWDRAAFSYQPSLTGAINATGICDTPKSNNSRYSTGGGKSW
jgi:hypothetical protein